MTTPSEAKKDVIYIDVDDEITAIIEKLRNSKSRIVALVLPKRSAVLQSIVNMKLLKRTADTSKKNVVLITSEAGLLPLAGAVGMHVANSLNSKPAIPAAPHAQTDDPDEDAIEDTDGSNDFDKAAAASQPVGSLANKFNEPETIQLDNEDVPPAPAGAAAGGAAVAAAAKKGKDKKLKIPNFNRFRLALVLGAVFIVVLIFGWLWANTALPKAQISLKTNSSDVDTKVAVIMDPKATEFDPASNVLPTKIATKQQTGSQQVSTSGQKNNGSKASGTVTLALKDCSVDSVTVPAGTGVSSNGMTFITQAAATMESVKIGGSCRNTDFKSVSTKDISVSAQQAGASYNISAASFTVAGYSNVSGSSSDPMTGGTDNIIKVVAQADIDSAKAKISSNDNSNVKSDLQKTLSGQGYLPILSSLNAGDPTVTSSANVGDQADTVTVTQVTAYSMYGVKQSDVKKVITANVNKQIDTTKQQILNDGAAQAKFQITSAASSGPVQATLTATSLAGPDIDTSKLASQFAGKKTGDIKAITKTIPGVSDVSVKYSPFWVNAVPKKTSKITIVIIKADGGTTTTQSSGDN
jgi:hypothetical protein